MISVGVTRPSSSRGSSCGSGRREGRYGEDDGLRLREGAVVIEDVLFDVIDVLFQEVEVAGFR